MTTEDNVVAMSTAKRSRSRRQPDARPAASSENAALPASKRLKSSHVPAKKDGLGFLVDEDARQGRKLEGKLTNGVLDKRNARVDESKAVVAPESNGVDVGKANEVIDISSAEDASSEDDSEEEDDVPHVNGDVVQQQAVAGAEDVEMVEGEAEAAEPEEPSFGDMLQSRHPDTIDVQASYSDAQPDTRMTVPAAGNVLTAPTGTTLTTVLTQALRTNDKDLLESCFQMVDQQSIRTTIQRLQPHLVGNLMQRLAERIHRRPGRTGHLMTWIQWSLVAHGGYLVTQPQILRQLRALNQVLKERAQGLQPLLQLKGKLDMLGAQLDLRRQTLASSLRAQNDEDDEEGVLYIEGRDEDDDGSESDAAVDDETTDVKLIEPAKKRKSKATKPIEPEFHTDSEDEGSDDDMPNGIAQEGESSADEEDEEERQGMFDLEAEESGEDDGSEEDQEEDDSSVSSAEDVEEDDEEDDSAEDEIQVKVPKPQTLQRKR